MAGVLLAAVVGLSVGLATSGGPARLVTPAPGPRLVKPGPRPRLVTPLPAPPAPGRPSTPNVVAAGVVGQVGFGSFTMTNFDGQTITVDEQSSTTYRTPSAGATASSVVQGALVAVAGTRNGTTVTASEVIVLRSPGLGSQ